ncbi:hypothetical protein DFH07DRAFT_772968 [Mycena maculata]|uniref:C2H2-type domain-containing protein n=1 Tax=Mycena maculata TaxID=230809 RepID=A0AAD7J507_9AGAR|nr:hypothetical protein DFH07DRAFT_772968 [Mycena maculata]
MSHSDLLSIFSIEPVLDENSFLNDSDARLDESLFAGSLFYEATSRDAAFDAKVPTLYAPAPALPFAGCDLSEESVDSIFADLYASCGSDYSTDLFAPVAPQFTSCNDSDSQATTPSSPVHTVSPSALALDHAAQAFVADRVAGAAHEDDESGDEVDADDVVADPDFEAISAPRTPPRAICPLPGRVFPNSSRTARSSRRVPAPASSSSSTSRSAPSSKKRKPARAAGPRATKKAAVRTRAGGPAPLPLVPSTSRAANHACGTSATRSVPEKYQYLLGLGCTVSGRGMLCNIKGCTRRTGNFADMDRHMVVHYPQRLECEGCPGTFSRKDPLLRHIEQKGGSAHLTKKRKAFTKAFRALPTVSKMREECSPDNLSQGKLNAELEPMFETLLPLVRPLSTSVLHVPSHSLYLTPLLITKLRSTSRHSLLNYKLWLF